MPKVEVINQSGEKVGEKELSADVFDVKINEGLVNKVLRAYLNNQRGPYAHTKTRAERRGGGAKPWRQKGTGRARAGSSRSPIWKKGGITFGPRNEKNFSIKVNKKEKKQVLKKLNI